VTGVLPDLESSVVLGILTVATVGSPKSLQHNHPGESATRATTTHPDSRQSRPMAASIGRADSGSLLASHDSELRAARQRRATDSGTGDISINPGPLWSTNQTTLSQRWLEKGSPV